MVEREAHFHRHLPVRDLVLLDMAADLLNLKPTQSAHGLRRLGNGRSDRVLDTEGGRARELDGFVNMSGDGGFLIGDLLTWWRRARPGS